MARNFNGGASGNRIDYPNVLNWNGQAQTTSFWADIDSIAGGQYFVADHTSGDGGLSMILWIDSSGISRLAFTAIHATTSLVRNGTSNSITLGRHHILSTWDGSLTAANVHHYVDNVEISYSATADGAGAAVVAGGSMSIAGRIFSDTRNLDAKLELLGRWNRVLTANERTGLSQGISPILYPNGLKVWDDLEGTPANKMTGELANNDGAAFIAGDKIIRPRPNNVIPFPTAVAVTISPWYQYQQEAAFNA